MMSISDWYYLCMYLLMLIGFCAFMGGLYLSIYTIITLFYKIFGGDIDGKSDDI